MFPGKNSGYISAVQEKKKVLQLVDYNKYNLKYIFNISAENSS